jgi:hypothetical protein
MMSLFTSLQRFRVFYRLHALMKAWCKKLALIVLLLPPLQGLAATLSAFTCYSGNAHQGTIGAHQHDGGTSHEHDEETGADHSGHLNCHHFFSSIPAPVAVTVPSDIPAFESSISLLFTLFVPERPQRPPRV